MTAARVHTTALASEPANDTAACECCESATHATAACSELHDDGYDALCEAERDAASDREMDAAFAYYRGINEMLDEMERNGR